MKVDVHITEIATGETRVYHDDYEWTGYSEEQFPWMADRSADAGVKFQWSEGNYACDCNRFLFFHRVAHPWTPDCEEPDRDCGDDAYQIKIIESGTDRVIYEEA